MENYSVSSVVACDRDQLYQVVSGIEQYPDFVPGYKKVVVNGRSDGRLEVTQTVSILGGEVTFDSLASLVPPESLVIDASPPGFRVMRIEWRLEDIGSGNTRITISIHYEAGNFLARRFLRPWMQMFAGIQLRAFRKRINALRRRR